MKCPRCSAKDTRVVDSRVAKGGLAIRRRRQCLSCDHRFTTIEEIARESATVLKRDGSREAFAREKLLNGIRRACEKRPVEPERLQLLVQEVLLDLEREFDNEYPSQAIGQRVMARLKSIDKIAYVRFASVYKDFRDIAELADEIHALRQGDEEEKSGATR